MRHKILALLEENDRMPLEEIAVQLGITINEAASIIADAEKAGIIKRYKAVIDWEKLEGDSERTLAIIEVKVTPERDFGFEKVANRIKKFDEVHSLYLLSGGYDLHVVVEGENIKDIANFVSKKLSTIDSVISTATHFLLKVYKNDGDIMNDDEEGPERIPVSAS